jgi:predicted secreted hydrolase
VIPSALCSRRQAATEWWYYHGHLRDDRREYGFHAAFFRQRTDGVTIGRIIPVSLASKNLWFAHFALSDLSTHRFHYGQRRTLGPRGGAAGDRYAVWLGDWRAEGSATHHTLQAQFGDVACRLELAAAKPPICHRDDAVDGAAHWSYTRMQASGTLTHDGQTRPIIGEAWMDRECGPQLFGAPHTGWNWFGIQLNDGRELMVYDFRDETGARNAAARACLVGSDDSRTCFGVDEFRLSPCEHWTSPRSACTYPIAWQLSIPSCELELTVQPYMRDHELDTYASTSLIYWEGPAAVQGHCEGKPVTGRCFLELVGYDRLAQSPQRFDFAARNWSFTGWAGSEFRKWTTRKGIVHQG